MAWCEIKGKECPVPNNIRKLRAGEATDTEDKRGIKNLGDIELITRMTSLVEYMGEMGTCKEGPDEDDDFTDGKSMLSCEHTMSLEVDFVTYSAFGIYVTVEVRPH